MALTVSSQLRYWGISAVIFCLILWFLGNTLLPFILGGAIAYCLDPVADRLQHLGLSRLLSTALITLVAMLAFFLMKLHHTLRLVEDDYLSAAGTNCKLLEAL